MASQATVQYQSEAGLVAGHITSLDAAAVPEPSTLVVLALGGMGLAVARRKAARGQRPIERGRVAEARPRVPL